MEPRAEVVAGFRMAGVRAGLKTSQNPDLGLIVADRPAVAAGVFTTNRVKAAPVSLAQTRLRAGSLRAIAANSGSANCFTGAPGMKLAQASCTALARALGCPPALVIPCSTGVIGHLYDLQRYRDGIRAALAALAPDGLSAFAQAIMTTDTRPKLATTTLRAGGTTVTVTGVAKGAGMIAPNMATMLAFILTDAALPLATVRHLVRQAAAPSFNAITVDGDMSTNDSLILAASGAAANGALRPREIKAFADAVSALAGELARQMVFDGEGASKLVSIEVRGARRREDAERVARQIANSLLVKTAFFGCDPNVGRIAAAAGACGVTFDPQRLELWIDRVRIAARGKILVAALPAAALRMKQRQFALTVDLKQGRAVATVLTSDLSYDYVKINAEYTT
ncbi:MAG TPA: bifunctional glutamate N-acetyltransferase/amino-acid acetyltransferase ArgJ [Candidatus Binataceae bacterium]|nr:bifunctional glutamate N-acetyltransferase/amino-acid acetyltransferase ArgJ [Candidatus Binataceae bacterium]